jgi:hypothetical protein
MKKILVLALLVGLGLSYSCKKQEKKEEPQPAPTNPNPAPATPQIPQEPEGKVIAPEAYYQFEVDRLELLKKHKNEFLQMLKSTKTKNQALIDKVIDANKSIVSAFIALTDKDKITAPDYKKTNTDPEAKKANDEYIAKHPEIKEKMDSLQKEVVKIEDEVKAEVERLKITQEDLVPNSQQQPKGPDSGKAPEKESAPPTKPGK